jgi:CubicO group peptidase (beta-lactamase class C family)
MRNEWIYLAAFLPLLVALTTTAQPFSRSTAPASLDTGAIDPFIIRQMAVQRVPGLALAIVQDDTTYTQGYGQARSGEPVTPQTRFLVASLSKSFTALAVMQLVEAGQIDLDAPVQQYLPDFTLADPQVAAQITVRQLLNQVSGLADAGFPEMRLPTPATLADRITTLSTAEPVTMPGTEYHYFNANYQILARLIEVVSGEPFSDYMQAHLFAPLQMNDTTDLINHTDLAQKPENLAQGHLLVYGLPLPSGEETGFLGGSGGIVSTAHDMANFLAMQLHEGRFQDAQLLSPQGIATTHTPPAAIDSPYAMGWWQATTADGVPYLTHNGILSTFYAEMVLLPETRQGFVLLYNIHSLAHDAIAAPKVKDGLIALLQNKPPAEGGFNVTLWAVVIGLITLASVALEVRGLRRWSRRPPPTTGSRWRLLGLLWDILPAALVLAMPTLVLRGSDRAFGYLTLFRSMFGVMTWLSLCAVFGVLNALARLAWAFGWRTRQSGR